MQSGNWQYKPRKMDFSWENDYITLHALIETCDYGFTVTFFVNGWRLPQQTPNIPDFKAKPIYYYNISPEIELHGDCYCDHISVL